MVSVGQSVIARGEPGVVRFVGTTEFSTGVWVGLQLDSGMGKNDGSVGGKRYFTCLKPGMCGIFVRPGVVEASDEGDAERSMRPPPKTLSSRPASALSRPASALSRPVPTLSSNPESPRLEQIILKLQEKLRVMHLDIESYKTQVADLNAKNVALASDLATADEARELDLLNRDLSESTLEQLQALYDELLEKYNDLQLEFIDLQEELRLRDDLASGSPGDAALLQKRNQMLEVALLKLKEMSHEREQALERQAETFRAGFDRSVELERVCKETADRLSRAEALVEELRSELNLVDHSASVVEALTDQNAVLTERISGLVSTVEELEQMQEIDRDLEATRLEVERDLREEIKGLGTQLQHHERLVQELRSANEFMDKQLVAAERSRASGTPAKEAPASDDRVLRERINALQGSQRCGRVDEAVAREEGAVLRRWNELLSRSADVRIGEAYRWRTIAARLHSLHVILDDFTHDYGLSVVVLLRVRYARLRDVCLEMLHRVEFGDEALPQGVLAELEPQVERLIGGARNHQLEVKLTETVAAFIDGFGGVTLLAGLCVRDASHRRDACVALLEPILSHTAGTEYAAPFVELHQRLQVNLPLKVVETAQAEGCDVTGVEEATAFKALLDYLLEVGAPLEVEAVTLGDTFDPSVLTDTFGSPEALSVRLARFTFPLMEPQLGPPRESVWAVVDRSPNQAEATAALRVEVVAMAERLRAKEVTIEEMGLKLLLLENRLTRSAGVAEELDEARLALAEAQAECHQLEAAIERLQTENERLQQEAQDREALSARVVGDFGTIYKEKEKADKASLIAEIHGLRGIIQRCTVAEMPEDWLVQKLCFRTTRLAYRNQFRALGGALRELNTYQTIPFGLPSAPYYLSRMEEDYHRYCLQKQALYIPLY